MKTLTFLSLHHLCVYLSSLPPLSLSPSQDLIAILYMDRVQPNNNKRRNKPRTRGGLDERADARILL